MAHFLYIGVRSFVCFSKDSFITIFWSDIILIFTKSIINSPLMLEAHWLISYIENSNGTVKKRHHKIWNEAFKNWKEWLWFLILFLIQILSPFSMFALLKAVDAGIMFSNCLKVSLTSTFPRNIREEICFKSKEKIIT